ncbi:hypothetical protein [Bradyrhizobium icense]|uniref:hypothetical protein n=1 Tax=Bradyrhizobium icense TaxID=1274631 RepID=UPI001F22161B|nr:hypothetical protein [Bradyrhizobium icense]
MRRAAPEKSYCFWRLRLLYPRQYSRTKHAATLCLRQDELFPLINERFDALFSPPARICGIRRLLRSKGATRAQGHLFRDHCHHDAAEQGRFAARLGKLVPLPTLVVTKGNRSSSLILLAELAGPMWQAGGTLPMAIP